MSVCQPANTKLAGWLFFQKSCRTCCGTCHQTAKPPYHWRQQCKQVQTTGNFLEEIAMTINDNCLVLKCVIVIPALYVLLGVIVPFAFWPAIKLTGVLLAMSPLTLLVRSRPTLAGIKPQ
jgi:hypothetical protein